MKRTGSKRRTGLVVAAVAVAIVVVTLGLFPKDCGVKTTFTTGPVSRETETQCKTASGLEWPGLAVGGSVVVLLDVLLLAAGFAVIRSSKKARRPY